MQAISSKYYFCYPCQKTVMINTLELLCPACGSDFLQEAKIPGFEARNDLRTVVRNTDYFGPHSRLFGSNRENRLESIRNIHDVMRNLITNLQARDQILDSILNLQARDDSDSESEGEVEIESIQVDENEESDCKICTANFLKGEEKCVLECCHEYHVSCLVPWLKIKRVCPFCRHKI